MVKPFFPLSVVPRSSTSIASASAILSTMGIYACDEQPNFQQFSGSDKQDFIDSLPGIK